MAFVSNCCCHLLISPKMNSGAPDFTSNISAKRNNAASFAFGSRLVIRPNLQTTLLQRKNSRVSAASWLASSEIARSVVPVGSVAVLPFYIFMAVAPKAKFTHEVMESSMAYIVLGLVYAYLVYISWTPDTIQLLFIDPPELAGIAKLVSSEMTLASVWIHLLAVDLFAARHIYRDGLENDIETRHSVSLCLISCPIGLVSHFITKMFYSSVVQERRDI